MNNTPDVLCCVCHKPLEAGQRLQAYLRNPDEPNGSWTSPAEIDEGFKERCYKNADKINRKHEDCEFDVSWSLLPVGTKVHCVTGGNWIRVKTGWRWPGGGTFPTPGGDWSRIELTNGQLFIRLNSAITHLHLYGVK